MATVLDASGRDIVMIETVGVGQDEVDIVRLADVTIVVLVPGMGDDVQTIKAGIMEIADIFVINKSDRDGAERVEREIRAMQSLAIAQGQLDSADREDGGERGNRRRRIVGGDRKLPGVSAQNRIAPASAASKTGGNALRRCCATRSSSACFPTISARRRGPRYATEVAEHKRDPYSLVEKIVGRIGEAIMSQIDHLGIAVKSLAEARKFYEKLGLQVMPEETVETEKVRLAMVPVGESRIELLEPTSPESAIAKFLAKRGEGLHHVALHVDDLSARSSA